MKPKEKQLEADAKYYLRNVLSTTTNTNAKDLDLLVNLFELVSYKKNHIVINENEVSENFFFIYKGIIRVYYFKNDKLVIERFETEGGLFGGNFSHLTKKPGLQVYETVEDSVMLKIRYEDLNNLCIKNYQIEHVYRVMMEAFHSNYVYRLTALKSASSEERYRDFVKEYGDVANRVSLKDIANYLGMTSETISRIRAKSDKAILTKK